MKLDTAIIIILCGIVGAFIVPKDGPDGFYVVPFGSNWTALAKPFLMSSISPTPETGNSESRRSFDWPELEGRQLPAPRPGCDGYQINTQDFAFAQASFLTICQGNIVPPNWAYYAKFGSSVAYMCNYGGNNPCWFSEYGVSMNLVSSTCGGNRAGWVLIQDWKKGYGRSNTGAAICSWWQVIS